mgnify:CR=1 FL=1
MMKGGIGLWVSQYAERLRFPRLVALTAVLFLLDLVIPDLVPFVDEILLGLLTAVLASFKNRKAG